MTGLIDAAFSRTRVVMTALVVLALFGLAAYNKIPREADPDVVVPFVLVTVPLPGISPEDGERLLLKPTELEVQTIEGLKELNSIAYDGVGQIFIEFETNINIDNAIADVREAIDRAKTKYPLNAEEPIVTEFNVQSQFPILTIIISGNAPERALYKSAKKLQDRLESLSGVLDAKLTGAREELLEVIIDPEILESYGLTELEVVSAVTSNNQLITAGNIKTSNGKFAVKAPGLIKSAEDLMKIPVRVNGDNIVTVAEVADIRRTFVDREGYAIFNGKPAIGIEISKRTTANIVETIEAARAATADEAIFWPTSINHTIINDQSIFVKDALEGLTGSIITAVFLVMIVVVAALGLRSAIMVGIAIPSSFLIAFLFLSAIGMTLNMMVMFALILSVGMLVDGAIVIIEYADRRMAEGADRKIAYSEASKRMFWPVLTSTATTLAAFFPFLFWNDTIGEFMKFLPITLITVLLSSLLVALIFLPVLGSLMRVPDWLKEKFGIQGKTDKKKIHEVDEVDPTTLDGPLGIYARTLTKFVQNPIMTLGLAGIIVTVCFFSFKIASPEQEFFIRNDEEQINVLALARGNLSAEQKINIIKDVAARVEEHPDIEHLYLQTGPEFAQGNDIPSEAIGQVSIDLVPYPERRHSSVILQEIRGLVTEIPGIFVEVRQPEGGPPIGKDVQVEISSSNFDLMIDAAKEVRKFLETKTTTTKGANINVYMDIEDTLPLPGIEWEMNVDRTMAGLYGLDVQQAGAVLQFVTDGLLIDRYRPDDSDDELDIRARFPAEIRTVLALDKVRVQTASGSVPLSNFVSRTAKPQVDRIVRRDGRRIIEIKANGNTLVPGHEISQDQSISHIREWLDTKPFPEGVNAVLLGADEETAAAADFFAGAMMLALFLIAMILLLEFDSFYHAALTLVAVVLSVFGVLLGIALSGQYVSVIMTGVGIVALAGIVVNNNIVLIDTYQHLRKKGLPVEEAVIRTAAQRIRPVILTTTTTILGLLPMVFEISVNFPAGKITHGSAISDWWTLISSTIVYGLAFSTMLTLILTPTLLAAPTVIRKKVDAFRQRNNQEPALIESSPEAKHRQAAE